MLAFFLGSRTRWWDTNDKSVLQCRVTPRYIIWRISLKVFHTYMRRLRQSWIWPRIFWNLFGLWSARWTNKDSENIAYSFFDDILDTRPSQRRRAQRRVPVPGTESSILSRLVGNGCKKSCVSMQPFSVDLTAMAWWQSLSANAQYTVKHQLQQHSLAYLGKRSNAVHPSRSK